MAKSDTGLYVRLQKEHGVEFEVHDNFDSDLFKVVICDKEKRYRKFCYLNKSKPRAAIYGVKERLAVAYCSEFNLKVNF